MAKQTIIIDPITRIEGHLKIEVDVENSAVVDARSCGTLWRGFEVILQGRDPRDAQMITQRICGVCPISHGIAATQCLDNAFKVTPPANGRIIRNLIFSANYLQSHILHFYHLAALDYVTGPDVPPFVPRYKGDYRLPKAVNDAVVGHYLQALDMRLKAHELAALWAGKIPMAQSITPGGVTQAPSVDKIASTIWRIRQLKEFINSVYVPDVEALGKAYEDYFKIGTGYGNLLSFGVFPQNADHSELFFKRGRITSGNELDVDPAKIYEDIRFSKYTDESPRRHPGQGVTSPDAHKENAYSWVKAPRYDEIPHEVGPLARMAINGDYGKGVSVMDRHVARAYEARKIAAAMEGWAMQLKPGEPMLTTYELPAESEGMGLTEAPRGALGHWIKIEKKKISRYQCVVPSTWNCSPRDNNRQYGPLEKALIGTPVADADNPIEVARVVRSFDPCLACAVHIMKPSGEIKQFRVC